MSGGAPEPPSKPDPCTLGVVRDEGHPYVEGVVLAEFDIDLGAVVRCSWPRDFGDGKYLAEQMLPDRSEGHEELQTVFFMNRPNAGTGKPEVRPQEETVKATLYREKGTGWTRVHPDEEEVIKIVEPKKGVQGSKGEIFILSAKRETLQSIPITPEIEFEVAEDISLDPTTSVQAVLLKGTGAGHVIGLVPREGTTVGDVTKHLESGKGNTTKSEKTEAVVTTAVQGPPTETEPFLYCQNIVRKKKDTTVRRGAVIKAVAVMCRSPVFVWCFSDLMRAGLRRCLDIRDDDGDFSAHLEVVKALYDTANNETDLKIKEAKLMSAKRCRVWQYVIKEESKIRHMAKVSFQGVEYPVAVPLHVGTQEFCIKYGSVRELYNVFKEAVPGIIDAILSGLRVIFITYNRSAQEVCSLVLAAVSCIIPPFDNIIKTHVFPYTSLTCMDHWSSLPSYVVGATNPMFEHRKELWDILCNVDTGKMSISADVVHPLEPSDTSFALKLMSTHSDEGYLRYHTRVYFANILKLAIGDCHGIPDTELHTLWENNTLRIKKWKEGGFLNLLPEAFSKTQPLSEAVHGLLRLRGVKPLTEEDSIVIYQNFIKTVRSEEDLLVFLSHMPKEAEGLFPVALGLFHPSYAVKLPCIAFLRRLDSFPEGKLVIHSLNTFMLLAYERNSRIMPVT